MLIDSVFNKRHPELAINASYLIERGYLVPCSIYWVNNKQVFKGKNYNKLYTEAIVKNDSRNNKIVTIALNMRKYKKLYPGIYFLNLSFLILELIYMYSKNDILSPFTLPNGTQLKNRILMAPMTTCTGYYDGSVTNELVEYYRERAGSIGTVIVECGFIDDRGLAFPGAIGIDHDNKIEGLAKIAEAIQSKGSKAVLQIYHGGRMVEPDLIGGKTPVGPSAIAAPREGAATPVALTSEEVDEMITKFGEGVRRAIKVGFDGVEIHGANTYLIQQFFSPNSNQRNDQWGGSRENRARFPLAVLEITQKMVRQYADPSFIIGYRFSPEELEVPGIRFDDTLYLLERLADLGLHYLHFSMGYTLRSSIVDKNGNFSLSCGTTSSIFLQDQEDRVD
jgi:2,4-dienoyl-CoA reductase-like NADH-dependent reductase (Old Yellow Enzyme family)